MQYVQYGDPERETILLLHGGGLSWWNYREAAGLLAERYHVLLPILDGHSGSDRDFDSIEKNAERILCFLDANFGGKVLALGGLSLGGQIAAQMLAQRPDVCGFALLESTLAKPQRLTHALIGPTFSMSYGLIRQMWFARLQAAYLGIPERLFEDYYRDTCRITKENLVAFLQSNAAYSPKPGLRDTQAKVHIVFGSREQAAIRRSAQILHERIPNSTVDCIPGLRHGELSIRYPEAYVQLILNLIFSQ